MYLIYFDNHIHSQYNKLSRRDSLTKTVSMLCEPIKTSQCNEYLAWGSEMLGEDKAGLCKKMLWFGKTGGEMWTVGFDKNDRLVSNYPCCFAIGG